MPQTRSFIFKRLKADIIYIISVHIIYIKRHFSENIALSQRYPAKSDIYRSLYSPPARRCDRLGTTEEGHVGYWRAETAFLCRWLVIENVSLTFPVNCQKLIGQSRCSAEVDTARPFGAEPRGQQWLVQLLQEVCFDWMWWGWWKGILAEIESDSNSTVLCIHLLLFIQIKNIIVLLLLVGFFQ